MFMSVGVIQLLVQYQQKSPKSASKIPFLGLFCMIFGRFMAFLRHEKIFLIFLWVVEESCSSVKFQSFLLLQKGTKEVKNRENRLHFWHFPGYLVRLIQTYCFFYTSSLILTTFLTINKKARKPPKTACFCAHYT